MTGTTCEIERSYPFQAKIPCMTLNNLIMENANVTEVQADSSTDSSSDDSGN